MNFSVTNNRLKLSNGYDVSGSINTSSLLVGSSVGINPTSTLDVSGTANITGNLSVDISSFFVNTSNKYVGVGTNNPNYPLEITGEGGGKAQMRVRTNNPNSSNDAGILLTAITNNIAAGRSSSIVLDPNGANGTGSDYLYIEAKGDGSTLISNQNNAPLSLQTNKVDRLTILGDGNVGIGTSTPTKKLDISGDFKMTSTTGELENYRINSSGGPAFLYLLRAYGTPSSPSLVNSSNQSIGRIYMTAYNGTTYVEGANIDATIDGITPTSTSMPTKLTFSTTPNGTTTAVERVAIKNDGNVGIGTNTPSYKLDVNGQQQSKGYVVTGDYPSLAGIPSAGLYAGDSSFPDGFNSVILASRKDASRPIIFSTNNGSAFGERVRIAGSGNVGIGTTTPLSRLDITTPSRSSLTTSGSAINVGYDEQNDTNFQTIGFSYSGSTPGRLTSWGMGFKPTDFSNGYGDLFLYSQGAEALRINRFGNVGIGTTTPGSKLQVNGKTVVGSDANNALEVFSSGDTEIGFSYQTRGNIYSKIIGDVQTASPLGGDIAFQTANNGVLAEVMRLKDNGRVGIGTTGPGGKLDVIGGDSTTPALRIQSTLYPQIHIIGSDPRTDNRNWSIASSFDRIGALQFMSSTTSGSTPNTSRMLIDGSSGNVGIATTSPQGILDVNGQTILRTPLVKIGVNAGLTNQGLRAIAIGSNAGISNQGENSIAIGEACGAGSQQNFSVAIGYYAADISQQINSIAIGRSAARNTQGQNSIAIGNQAGCTSQGNNAIAIGNSSGSSNQNNNGIAIGQGAGQNTQGLQSIAIGTFAGTNTQGSSSIAIGNSAGNTSQGPFCTAFGDSAGFTGQRSGAISIGFTSGLCNQGTNAVAIGTNAGNTGQGTNAVAIGTNAGQNSQRSNCIAIGHNAGTSSQQQFCIAIGSNAGHTFQQYGSVAIGLNAGQTNQSESAVAIGQDAGASAQDFYAVAIGSSAGTRFQKQGAVAIGTNSGLSGQGSNAISIGYDAGNRQQGSGAVAIGYLSGFFTQGVDSVAIGVRAGNTNQGFRSVAIGSNAGFSNQREESIAIGYRAGEVGQQQYSIAIGWQAAQTGQRNYAVAIGFRAQEAPQTTADAAVAIGAQAGQTSQAIESVAIGPYAGTFNQSQYSVAIGRFAGFTNQNSGSIAIGNEAGRTDQSANAVAIGWQAGYTNQRSGAIAIGFQAGYTRQGTNAIAIGTFAGFGNSTGQANNSIVINATGNNITAATASATYIAPLRQETVTTNRIMFYNTSTNELTYSSANSGNAGKTFVIPHPTNNNKYLVHACLEGPETAVFYRGKGEITNNSHTTINLPDYASLIAKDFTIQINPIYDGTIKNYNTSEVQNNSFNVFGVNGKFHWLVLGKRQEIEVEPDKNNYTLNANGPYTWLSKK